MPFYEYECSNCRFYVEVLQRLSDQPLKKCPSCGKNALKKLVSAPVFRLKGSGWYETDFKSDQEGKRNLAGADKDEPSSDKKADAKPASGDGKAETKSDASSSTKADAKPDTKAESNTSTVSSGKRSSGAAAKSKPAVKAKPAKPAKPAKRAPAKPKAAAKRRRGR
jgi:putative FmdB family regulatory protein